MVGKESYKGKQNKEIGKFAKKVGFHFLVHFNFTTPPFSIATSCGLHRS
jgi:hypothetical protein